LQVIFVCSKIWLVSDKTTFGVKKILYFALFDLILFEIANVYFIMPMPGSQRMDSVGLAYFLYSWRWLFRLALGALAVYAFTKSRFKSPWSWLGLLAMLGLWAFVTYQFNFEMTADRMFLPPKLVMLPAAQSQVDTGRVVLGVALGGAAKAYPIQFLAYHHQVRDTVGRVPVMVTYCNVCRTGRVFSPTVNGQPETFRLVGMDHFNAMFEDARTRSWWRQENGEAVAGPLRGQALPELPYSQMTLNQWLKLYPASGVMQADTTFKQEYEYQQNYENGNKKGTLTRTDSLSWQEKSWVVGVEIGDASGAFDWNDLKTRRVLNEQVEGTPIVIALAADNKSFAAFKRPAGVVFALRNDSLVNGSFRYDLAGRASQAGVPALEPVAAYQEFWHSWQAFHGK
jgi:hypothetical protein